MDVEEPGTYTQMPDSHYRPQFGPIVWIRQTCVLCSTAQASCNAPQSSSLEGVTSSSRGTVHSGRYYRKQGIDPTWRIGASQQLYQWQGGEVEKNEIAFWWWMHLSDGEKNKCKQHQRLEIFPWTSIIIASRFDAANVICCNKMQWKYKQKPYFYIMQI